jgi:hypothetical protein
MMVDSSVAQWQSQGYVNTAAGPNEAALRGEIDRLQKEVDDPRSAQDRASLERAACEEYTEKLRQYEQQLQRINDERRALEECIRQCLDQHNRAATIPSPEMGCIDPRTGTPQQSPIQKSPQQAPYPQPVPDSAQRLVPLPPFPTQPASYHAEPAPIPTSPQFVPQTVAPRPIVSPQFAPQALGLPHAGAPQQHVIREPAAPAARITGFLPGR